MIFFILSHKNSTEPCMRACACVYIYLVSFLLNVYHLHCFYAVSNNFAISSEIHFLYLLHARPNTISVYSTKRQIANDLFSQETQEEHIHTTRFRSSKCT